MARGQQRIKRMHKRRKVSMVCDFILQLQTLFQAIKTGVLDQLSTFSKCRCVDNEHIPIDFERSAERCQFARDISGEFISLLIISRLNSSKDNTSNPINRVMPIEL